MRTSFTRSARHFNVHSNRGSITQAEPSFTTGLVSDTGGTYTTVSDDEVIAAALRILSKRMVGANVLTNPRLTREYLAIRFAELEHEVFACIFLDNRNRVIACEELFRGTIDEASVYPREVVKRALFHNAAALILSHCHPSGLAEPSRADEMITRQLQAALSLVQVKVLDHLVVGAAAVESFAERGLL